MEKKGRLTEAGLGEVEISGKPQMQAFAKFELEDGKVSMWKGFVFKKTGEVSKKTEDNLKAMGFKGFENNKDQILKLSQNDYTGILDITKTYDLTFETTTKDGKTYENIEWINDPAVPRAAALKKVSNSLLMEKFGINAESSADEIPF